MMLARFIVPLDLRVVIPFVGVGCKMLGVVFIPPGVVALLLQEYRYAIIAGGVALIGYLVGVLVTTSPRPNLEIKEALAATALVYMLFALVGAIMFLPIAPFIDAFFESMSGFTTTGLSVLNTTPLPKTLLFFRAYAQWIGGAGIIVLSLAIFLGPGRAASQLYTSEVGAKSLFGSVVATARIVGRIYLGLTVVGFLIYMAVGMKPFEAILHVLATLSTGGFSPYPESIGHFSNRLIHAATILFMLVGATTFSLYFLAYREGLRRFWEDRQVRALIVVAMLGTLFLGVSREWRADAWLSSLFESVSALTTTGFGLRNATSWSASTRLGLVLLMVIGGATGSTAGGLKLFRLIILLKLANWMVIRELLPGEAQVPIKYGEQTVAQNELLLHSGYFLVYTGMLTISTLLLVLAGFTTLDALFETASALGTVGLSVGVTSADLPSWTKLLLIFNMWAGRLEIFPVLVLLYPWAWKLKRKAK